MLTDQREFMALTIEESTQITVGDANVWAVAGDTLVDIPGGGRLLLHKIDFDKMVEGDGYKVSRNLGFGWVRFKMA